MPSDPWNEPTHGWQGIKRSIIEVAIMGCIALVWLQYLWMVCTKPSFTRPCKWGENTELIWGWQGIKLCSDIDMFTVFSSTLLTTHSACAYACSAKHFSP